MYSIIRNILFRKNPEDIHYWAMAQLKKAYNIPFVRNWMKSQFQIKDSKLEREVWGLKFPNPVGLAAGFDKDARWINELSMLGFGFIEIGTVTPVGQPGNPKPRLFRLPEDRALINRMGFNNEGAVAAAERLRNIKTDIIIGGNIGKNKETPNELAINDYEKAFLALYDVVDYFVVNVSSPNTPNLRALQDKGPLTEILLRLKEIDHEKGKKKPILLKIAPDLTNGQLDDIVALVHDTKIEGIVATNTTIDRSNLVTSTTVVEEIGAGGLSGAPLRDRSTEVIRYLYEKSGKTLKIIAAGGVYTAEDAKEKLAAGAILVQVYSGFIYEGPSIAKNINTSLLRG